ncbi:hypothetical protein [Flavobacterium defluvii]|uniref:DKNYY family protein n=1 Tax=Flavobacterium defluvii TaxID=370979 RepID=A0A1M5KUQ5_9FLAO|nr:hypothetical protein [Flavobacterium defluvii]SHG56572.1 hypothetical protein SAMN05443663_103189 [Flavobacterium defluvii]
MRTFVFLASLISFTLTAQVKEKDTLFFNLDKYYTISSSIELKQSNEKYTQKLAFQKMQFRQTNTDGYIYFTADSLPQKEIKPKKILSIKDYIENKKFYYDGNHNKIVDKWKLKDSLTDKYVIFFVNGNELIKSKNLEYISYYPIQKDLKIVENRRKDTLFFKLDNKYIYEPEHCTPKRYLLKDGGKSKTGTFFFEEFDVQTRPRFKSKKILDLESFVHSSRFYNSELNIIEDRNLSDFFSNYVVFLFRDTDNKDDYIQIKSYSTIE